MTPATMAPPDASLKLVTKLMKTDRTIGEMEQRTYDRIIKAHETWHEKGYWFDLEAGQRVIQFCETFCKHYKGEWAGKPMLLENWQKLAILEAFGWKRADGYRLFRFMWMELARKNGKSQLAAALGVYLLLADSEPGAEVYSSATKRDQARIVFTAAQQICKQNKELMQFVKSQRTNLSVLKTQSKFEPLSSEGDTLDGLSPHGNIVDEIHAHKDRRVWDTLVTAQGARTQPMNICLTTAGLFEPESIGWQLHDHATSILDTTVEDDSWFVWISSSDQGDDPYAPETWEKANPNLGVSIYPQYLEQMSQLASAQPSFLNSFLRLHCNVWTQQVERWLDADHWEACSHPVELDELEGRDVYMGLDLSSKLDLTALALVFPPIEDELWRLWVQCYIPRESMQERERLERIPYELWERQGWVTPTEGDVIDYDFILRDIEQLSERFNVVEVAYDPWAAQQTALKIRDDLGLEAVPMRQGFMSLSEPTKELERLVVSGKLAHGGNSCLTWQANNTTLRHDPAGNIKVDKAKSQKHKIDGIAASIMAIGRASLHDGDSIYETEGIMVL
jgi:phage terminase large subunit-like protein